MSYCEAQTHAMPHQVGAWFCEERATHGVFYVRENVDRTWKSAPYVRYVCLHHAEVYCNRGWDMV